MKISTKGRYGTRFMLELAIHHSEGPISIKDISERQEISDKYLEQIIPMLIRAGFIRSIRGPQGGYMLVKEPRDITIGMILRVLEGSLAPVECVECGDKVCSRTDKCITLGVWTKIYEAVSGVVDNITLADLAEQYHVKNAPEFTI